MVCAGIVTITSNRVNLSAVSTPVPDDRLGPLARWDRPRPAWRTDHRHRASGLSVGVSGDTHH
jgi:hypothetical protein